MAGSGGTTYTVTINGDARDVYDRVSSQPWVTGIEAGPPTGKNTWQVSVSETDVAKAQLLRLILADDHLSVAEFTRKKVDLEEVFLDIVEKPGEDMTQGGENER